MIASTSDKDDITQQLDGLLRNSNSLVLATINAEGLPEASHAPYVEHDGRYYIFVSGLASHTGNLLRSGVASALFMNSGDDVHAYSRKRLTCQCDATAINRQDSLFESIMQLMEERFGKLIATLRGLGDFQLFQLNPVKGNFVAGFGQAYEIDFPLGGHIRHTRPD